MVDDVIDISANQKCDILGVSMYYFWISCKVLKDQILTLSLPVDQSRVKLLPIEDDESSDYINANYMPVSS